VFQRGVVLLPLHAPRPARAPLQLGGRRRISFVVDATGLAIRARLPKIRRTTPA
jgi:hypothetical protein